MLKTLKKRLKNQRGLTLVELLAVIVILGIISAIAVPSIGNVLDNSKREAIKADAVTILNSAKFYLNDHEDHTGNLDQDSLKDYIESVTTFPDGYTVNVDGNAVSLTADGQKGKVEIEFTNATLDLINKAPKDAHEIKPASGNSGDSGDKNGTNS